MPDVDLIYNAGTCSVAVGATSVVGIATLWNQPTNVRQWDLISINGGPLVPIIASPVDDTHITIPAWAGTAQTTVSYVIYQVSPLRFVGAQAMVDVETMLAALNTDGWYRYVNPAFAGPTEQGIVANEGQFALKYTSGQLWIMTGGVWVSVGVFKGIGVAAPYDNAHTYNLNDVATLNGSSYLWSNAASGSGHVPPNATYWAVLASVGQTGPTPLLPIVPWATGVAMVAGPPASYVSQNGSSYECLISHTSGTFATDLAAGKWGAVSLRGNDGANYAATSTTSNTIGTGSKTWTTQPNLGYSVGARVRVTDSADTTKWMDGVVTAYNVSSGSITINVDLTSGVGTFATWNFNIVGPPGGAMGSYARFIYTASDGQTVFTGNDDNLNPLANNGASFTELYIDGVMLPPPDYTVNSASQITLSNGCDVGQKVYIICFSPFNVSNALSLTANGADISDKVKFRSVLPNPGALFGLTLSTAGSSATFGVAAGFAADSTNVSLMQLASAYTKTTASWALGTAVGALDTGTIAVNTWYHVFLIQRPDTGVVDVLISLNATAPTLPASYTLFRRIGSMLINASSQWAQFSQNGDEFLYVANKLDIVSLAVPTTVTLETLASVPIGIVVWAKFRWNATSTAAVTLNFFSPAESLGSVTAGYDYVLTASGNSGGNETVRTDVSGRILVGANTTGCVLTVTTYGWIDRRGRDS
jgi:hypothetical protein